MASRDEYCTLFCHPLYFTHNAQLQSPAPVSILFSPLLKRRCGQRNAGWLAQPDEERPKRRRGLPCSSSPANAASPRALLLS